jgi:Flp pilus assembly CpaE family ATPase
MDIPILIAAQGGTWEAGLVLAFAGDEYAIEIARRCVDVVDLLAVAAAGQARVALIAAGLRKFDADAVDRLIACSVVAVAVVERDDVVGQERLQAMGVRFTVPHDADPGVIAAVIADAVSQDDTDRPSRAYGDPAAATTTVDVDLALDGATAAPLARGSVVAVWGPTGAPGRTTVAIGLADELARMGRSSLLVDADTYGGIIAPVLGLLDESPGLAAACRIASAQRLDAAQLSELCWQLRPGLRVLTGIPRAQRWPELRTTAIESVLDAARSLTEFVVVDCGFCLESDEELSYDSLAPRRNGATLAVLDRADVILAVGGADPIGLQRLVRGLVELREAEIEAPVWVVLNRVRRSVVGGDPAAELTAALERFAGRRPAALLPDDAPALDAALAAGQSLAEARPNSPLRTALRELASAVVGPAGTAAGAGAPPPKRRRALHRVTDA